MEKKNELRFQQKLDGRGVEDELEGFWKKKKRKMDGPVKPMKATHHCLSALFIPSFFKK